MIASCDAGHDRVGMAFGVEEADEILGSTASLAGGTLVAATESEQHEAAALAGTRFTVAMAANLAGAVTEVIEQGRLGMTK